MPEIYRTSLYTDVPQEELRLILSSHTVHFEVYRAAESGDMPLLVSRLSLPLSLWDRFYEAVCCLGTFMKPLPAPAYQARSCCSYTCALTPETVVLEHDRENIHLSLQDRRGSTFLEINVCSVCRGRKFRRDSHHSHRPHPLVCLYDRLWKN